MSFSAALFFQEQSQKSRCSSVSAHLFPPMLMGGGLAVEPANALLPPSCCPPAAILLPSCRHPALVPTLFPWEPEGGGRGSTGARIPLWVQEGLPSAQQEASDLGAQMNNAPPGDSASRAFSWDGPLCPLSEGQFHELYLSALCLPFFALDP